MLILVGKRITHPSRFLEENKAVGLSELMVLPMGRQMPLETEVDAICVSFRNRRMWLWPENWMGQRE